MASAIDPANPTRGLATTQSVRDNFQAAKDEIEALQAVDTAQDGRLDSHETRLNGHDQDIAAINTEQGTQNTRLDNIEALDTTQNSRLDGHDQDIAAINTEQTTQNTRLDSIEALNATQDSRLDGIDAEQITQNDRITVLENVPPATIEFPVGALMIGFNPNSVFPGTWTQLPEGTFLMNTIAGADPSGGSNDAIVPSHSHTASQAAHNHGVTDPGHNHVINISDPGHFHQSPHSGGGSTDQPSRSEPGSGATTTLNTLSASTGISASSNNSGTGISLGNATPAITVDGAGESPTGKNRPAYIGVPIWQRTA